MKHMLYLKLNNKQKFTYNELKKIKNKKYIYYILAENSIMLPKIKFLKNAVSLYPYLNFGSFLAISHILNFK